MEHHQFSWEKPLQIAIRRIAKCYHYFNGQFASIAKLLASLPEAYQSAHPQEWRVEVDLDLRTLQPHGLPDGCDAGHREIQRAASGFHDEPRHLSEPWKSRKDVTGSDVEC